MPNIFGPNNEDLSVNDLVPTKTQLMVGMLPARNKTKLQLMPRNMELAHCLMMCICQANGMKRAESDAISAKIRRHLNTASRKLDSYKQLVELLGVDTEEDNS